MLGYLNSANCHLRKYGVFFAAEWLLLSLAVPRGSLSEGGNSNSVMDRNGRQDHCRGIGKKQVGKYRIRLLFFFWPLDFFAVLPLTNKNKKNKR